jgi:hypothetical protein
MNDFTALAMTRGRAFVIQRVVFFQKQAQFPFLLKHMGVMLL